MTTAASEETGFFEAERNRLRVTQLRDLSRICICVWICLCEYLPVAAWFMDGPIQPIYSIPQALPQWTDATVAPMVVVTLVMVAHLWYGPQKLRIKHTSLQTRLPPCAYIVVAIPTTIFLALPSERVCAVSARILKHNKKIKEPLVYLRSLVSRAVEEKLIPLDETQHVIRS